MEDFPWRWNGLLALVVAGIGLAVCVVVLGAYTRLVDAGLGCPDWPGCYGLIGVPETPEEIAAAEAAFPDAPVEVDKAWPEMVHRYFATGLGALILGILGLAAWRKEPLKLPAILTVLVIVQGAFGAWTVTLKLWPQVVTAHLLGGMATLATLWLYALLLARPDGRVGSREATAGLRPRLPQLPDLRRLAAASLVVVILQIALGGWVSANYAGLACPDFPLCHGEVVPPLDIAQGFDVTQDVGPNYLGGQLDSEARIAIQIGHRLGAVLVLVVVGLLCVRLHRGGQGMLAGAVAATLGAQWLLGMTNVWMALPLPLAVLHNAFAGALLLAVVTVNFAAFGRPRGGVP